jgi:uncharacterized protein DUF222
MESRIAWTQMAAIAEFATRRRANQGPAQAQACEFAADELAAELRLTWQSAAGQIDYACAVAARLPRTFAALAAGTIHPVHARIIEDETSVLSAENAARADAELAATAASKTFGQLRAYAHRLVLKLDPDAARKRKEAARRDAHVRRFREDSGNAGMVAQELPPDEVLASWQHVEQRALDLRAAGVPGTLRELRVRAYLDLLQERDSRTAPAAPDVPGRGRAAGSSGPGRRPDDPRDDRGGPGAQPDQVLRSLGITLNMIIRGPCHHVQAERRYRPGRKLRHLVNVRNARCTAPGCGQSAARCDLDHTAPWHHDGLTCPCNLAPLCRHHHRCKQAEGWWLEQPEPGVLVWRTPSGRTYATTPTVYSL